MVRRRLKVNDNLVLVIDPDKKGVNIFHDKNFICYFNWNKKQHIEIKKPKNELNQYLSELNFLTNNTAQKLLNYFVNLEHTIKVQIEAEKQTETSEQIERNIEKQIVDKHGDKLLTLRETDEFCLYNKGYYQRGTIPKTKIKQEINKIAKGIEGFRHTISTRNNVYDLIRDETYVHLDTFHYNENIINVLNGLLIRRGKKWQFISHKKIEKPIRTFTQLPVEFNPKAKCPLIDKEISLIVGKRYKNDVYEMIGYFLIPTIKFQKAFMLFGPPSSGKTTLIEIITNFIGKEHICKKKLHELGRTFQIHNLRDKMVNIGDDLLDKPIKYTDTFNEIVTNKILSGEMKGVQDDVTWWNITKNLFGCNILPDDKYVSEGFHRRWILIPCYNIFGIKEIIRDFGDKISTQEELSGLLNKCLIAILRLEERKGFRQTEEYVRVTWALERNPVAQYTERYCSDNETGSIDCQLFYEMICNWRKKRGLPEISKSKCTRSLKSIYPKVRVISVSKKTHSESSGYKYRGISYNEDFKSDDNIQSIRVRRAFEDAREENEEYGKSEFETEKQVEIFDDIKLEDSEKIDANELFETDDDFQFEAF